VHAAHFDFLKIWAQLYLNEWHADFALSVAGTSAFNEMRHEMTSANAIESVFKYLEEMRAKAPLKADAPAQTCSYTQEDEDCEDEEYEFEDC